MLSLPRNSLNLLVVVVISYLVGHILLVLTPMLAEKPIILVGMLVMMTYFLMMLIAPEKAVMLLLMVRGLLDTALETTRTGVGGQSLSLGAGINLAIIMLTGILYLRSRKGTLPMRFILVWGAFLASMFFSTFYSPEPSRAFRLWLNFFTYACVFFLPFMIVRTEDNRNYWWRVLAWSFVFPVLMADLDLLKGGRYFSDSGIRIAGTFTHPNILAFYLVLGITIYFYILKNSVLQLKPKTLLWVKMFMLNMFMLLIATKSRNAWIASFVIFFIYGLLKEKKVLLILILLVPLSLLIPSVNERVFTVVKSEEKVTEYEGVNSFEWRLEVWKSSLPEIAKRPLEGHGLTSFLPLSGGFTRTGANVGAHNVYVELLFEIGILGLLSFLLLLFSPLKFFFDRTRRDPDPSQAKLWALLTAYLISYIIICSADNLLYYLALNWYVCFFLGLVFAGMRFPPNPSRV